MKRYQCHKVVEAERIIAIHGYRLILESGGHIEGAMLMARFTPAVGDYFVRYEDGYQSLSPAKAFEDGYSLWEPLDLKSTGMDFGEAVAALKASGRVARACWNGKGMFLFLVPGSRFTVNRPPLLGIYPEGTEVEYHAHIDMKTAQGYVVPWLASQADMLAADWEMVQA